MENEYSRIFNHIKSLTLSFLDKKNPQQTRNVFNKFAKKMKKHAQICATYFYGHFCKLLLEFSSFWKYIRPFCKIHKV